MENQLQQLKDHLREISDLHAAGALLVWDQATYMPPGGAQARGRQRALLQRLAHQRAVDPALGELLEDLHAYEESLDYESEEASLIRVARRDYERASRVPPIFLQRFSEHAAEAYQVWTRARPENDFSAVRPYLEKTLDLSREYAQFFEGYDHIADPLIDEADYGMTTASVSAMFEELRRELVPLVEAITSQPPADASPVLQSFPEPQQLAFGAEVIRDFGYDFERGRQDKTHHPFMTKFSLGDVRITTRVKENDLREALFSSLHEAGHALYEQGIDPSCEGTPLARGASSGTHESQSRLWENIVGRSRPFWMHYFPKLQAAFPDQLKDVSLHAFHRAINRVERSLIRTDADEVSYNLHVMIRFNLELEMLEDKLDVRHLPEAWRARYEKDLGIAPGDDKDGVLQDVHWYGGTIGGSFQGYALGNIIAAQIYDAAVTAQPEIPDQIESGKFGPLRQWLTDNVYRHGRKFTPTELIQRATGRPASIEPYMKYLRSKFGSLYDL